MIAIVIVSLVISGENPLDQPHSYTLSASVQCDSLIFLLLSFLLRVTPAEDGSSVFLAFDLCDLFGEISLS